MPFVHPDPLQRVSRRSWTLLTTSGKQIVVPASGTSRIIVKSLALMNYGAGDAVIDVIDRIGASEVNIITDAVFPARVLHHDGDDDGIIDTRAGAELVVNLKSILVVNIRMNFWYAP